MFVPRAAFVGVMFASLLVGNAAAQQADRMGAGPDQPAANDQAVQQLVDELNALIERGEKNRAADPRFLADLGQLAARYSWPWRVPVLADDFNDGDFTRNPSWTVASGDFWVDRQLGLRSSVEGGAPPPEAARRDGRDAAGAPSAGDIFGSVLGEIARQQGQGGRTGPDAQAAAYAEIFADRPFPNPFAIRLRLVSLGQGGQFEIGPYQGAERTVGYRLVIRPGADQGLQLVRQQAGGSGIIEVHSGPVDLRGDQTIEWTRDLGGRMTVAVGGNVLIDTVDRGLQDPFDGLTLVNLAGDFGVQQIELTTVSEQMSRRP